MKKYIFIAAVAALALAACTKNEISEENGTAIAFNSYTGRVSKAGSTFVDGSNFGSIASPQIGVYAYKTAAAFEGTETAAFMVNQLVTLKAAGDSASVNYTPLRYWPKDASKLSFFAYYPYNAAGLTLTDVAKSGLGKYAFTVQDAAADQIDFMVADLRNDLTYDTAATIGSDNGVVKFTFKHMLSQVKVYVKTDKDYSANDNTVITLDTLTFKNVNKTGELSASYASGATTWEDWTSTAPADFTIAEDVVLGTAEQLCADGASVTEAVKGIYLMIPQALTAGTVQVYIKYTIKTGTTPNTAEDSYEATFDLKTDDVAAWTPNKNVKYTFTIGLNPIQFAADVTPWETETTVNL